MDFKELKKKGYYLRVQKGIFNNKKHTEFSLVKDLIKSKNSKKIACILNLSAYRILKKDWDFKSLEDEKETCWLNEPESWSFYTQTKEPLKICL